MTIVNDRTITPPIHDPELDRRVKSAGASKTVYALVTPETEAVKNFLLGNAVAGPDAARRHHLEQFRDAWTGKQFASHEAFIERWMAWAAPVVAIDAAGFPWRYPTAGGSEALFHVITAYGNRARVEKFNPEVHVFAGEYEGYKAYAEACGIAVIEHRRAEWQAVGRALPKNALFCLSQPSAIDGNVWPHANDFLALLAATEKPRVLLDATYVGSIAEAPAAKIAVDSPAVQALAFSLSKPFGVYYDRIGGVLCRHAMPSLFGNQWFKNLTSLQLGLTLLERHDVFELPRRYKTVQREAAIQVGRRLGLTLSPSDVTVLAQAEANATTDRALADFLRRPAGDPDARLRLCLTPTMAEMIGTAGPIAVSGG
ncbi:MULTISPECIES: aminotransferase class I/II-fold pyridoxal phosphate-dependent enzyme [unclassified Bradyrhizobium]|uniref:aminotransferase class I/II-fold pyridoxal phosphate-dependent enzyme n=1 Tax=unclassified Bradyrhizobium TaxID=2631580 RepID=UPI001BA53A16|nr:MULTISPECIES: aminotransferase class I/II-fold pyridoxal phosphate-dependent enzyme [unclassified Bradyrhizobium]MBR1223553.1 aminotransferase class I/II-fold pyridoxal phosphate-dependent enzyme [Bradyrhizobium sp. AUGA SZCCT0176]MBR1296158.1 aminotransferase class I/II-fold pyridoxal phosphate-dependent enzyme [Bradyrhizobium sp. AUGA SZCCT0042]